MILTNRLFERSQASREAKSIYIFCEGAKREYDYFKYFREMDSRIRVEVFKLQPHDNNSPLGLFEIAQKSIIVTQDNPNPQYVFQENDEVWIVLDTDIDEQDSRKNQIQFVRDECKKKSSWFLVESNPCFEVWLYYHKNKKYEPFENDDACKEWKQLVNTTIIGGFHSSRHPIFIEDATHNAEANFQVDSDNKPMIGSTEVFRLSKSMLTVIAEKINEVKEKLK